MYIHAIEGIIAPGESVLVKTRTKDLNFRLGTAIPRANGNREFPVETGLVVIFGTPKMLSDGKEAVGQWVIG